MASEPSVLLPVANRPLVVHALDALAEAGVRRATVAAQSSVIARVEHELAQSCATDVQLTCVEHDDDGGLPAALADLEGFVGRDPFVLHLGDSLNRECLSHLLQAPTPEQRLDRARAGIRARRHGRPARPAPQQDRRGIGGRSVGVRRGLPRRPERAPHHRQQRDRRRLRDRDARRARRTGRASPGGRLVAFQPRPGRAAGGQPLRPRGPQGKPGRGPACGYADSGTGVAYIRPRSSNRASCGVRP